jgi:glycosyltransferase involved in cell wall biosynthesis
MSAEASVGVVVPAWNAELWLRETLESVLSQAGRVVDVLVLDDGSTDATTAVAESFGSPVRVVRQENGGIGAARNRGVELVAGELVTFVDADDLLTADGLACRVQALARRPEIDIVFGAVCQFSSMLDGAPVALHEPRPGHVPAAMLARRAALERVGPFVTNTHVSEGLDWLLRARELGLGEQMLEQQVIWRRVHGENNSLRHRAEIGEYARVLKASLDRRRAAAAPGGDPEHEL